MPVSGQRRSASPLGPQRGEQRGGIDLETRLRIVRDVRGDARRLDRTVLPEQQAASFLGRRGVRGPLN